MTENKMKLLEMVSNTPNPEKSVSIVIQTILGFLEQHESSQEPSSVYPQEHGRIIQA